MASEPELNRLAGEYREQHPEPTPSSFDGLDWKDYAPDTPPIFSNEVLARRVRLARFQLAAWVAPEPTGDYVPMLQEKQHYHGRRALELEMRVEDLSYQPENVLIGAQIWMAARLQGRHLQRAGEASLRLEKLAQEADSLQTAVS